MDGGDAYNISGNNLTSEDLLLNSITNDGCLHGDVALERRHDIGSLLLLVPADDGVEQQNSDNNTEINPSTQTSRDQDSDFHNCWGEAG